MHDFIFMIIECFVSLHRLNSSNELIMQAMSSDLIRSVGECVQIRTRDRRNQFWS